MKKKPKGKQNWFKIQFKKHPYLFTFVIGWPILFYIIGEFIDPVFGGRFDYFGEVLLIIFLSFPVIIFFLWFRKNKSKIKPFYKRNKKIFNRIYFYLGSVFSLIPIACIVGIIATGSVSNFTERVKFEINAAIYTYSERDLCQSPFLIAYMGYPKEFRIYFLKEQTQYLDYFENEIEPSVLRDLDFLNVNHCTGTRYLLKEAQEGSEVAKEILVAYPPELRDLYQFPPNQGENYIFLRYEKNIANMDLDNPAIAYSYAVYLNKGVKEDSDYIKPESLKYLKQSAEDGYLIAMSRLAFRYGLETNFNKSNCESFMKYTNILAEEKSLIHHYNLMTAYMGKISDEYRKAIYNCLGQKLNFSKAFSMLVNYPQSGSSYTKRMSSNFNSSYPAIFYLYGLGDVEQDYDKAYELFSYSEDRISDKYGIPDHAYIAYMNFMGMGVEQNPNKGIGLTIELAKKVPITKTQKDSWGLTLLCGGVNYNFIIPDLLILESYYDKKLSKSERKKKRIKYKADEKINEKIIKEYRSELGQCILDSEPEVSIKFLENYIFNRVSDFFQNPELVKTLNYLGEPK